MLHHKLLRAIQAQLVGFSTGTKVSWKRFCLFCLFHRSLSITGCLVQLVYAKFPSRVIHRGWLALAGAGIVSVIAAAVFWRKR